MEGSEKGWFIFIVNLSQLFSISDISLLSMRLLTCNESGVAWFHNCVMRDLAGRCVYVYIYIYILYNYLRTRYLHVLYFQFAHWHNEVTGCRTDESDVWCSLYSVLAFNCVNLKNFINRYRVSCENRWRKRKTNILRSILNSLHPFRFSRWLKRADRRIDLQKASRDRSKRKSQATIMLETDKDKDRRKHGGSSRRGWMESKVRSKIPRD